MMKKHRIWKIVAVALACITCLCFDVFAFQGKMLTQVQVQQTSTKLAKGVTISVSWQQTEAGMTSVLICDLDGNIVQTLLENTEKAPGTHQASWDGNDLNGNPCPVGAYLPIIKVKTRHGRVAVHNPTSTDWGSELPLEQPVYDLDSEMLTFQLSQPALCLLRIGKPRGGPCYGTLLNWEPRPAGEIEVPWNGWDAQSVVKVGEREELQFRLITIALPANAIVITSSPASDYPVETIYQQIPMHSPHGANVFAHAMHRRQICRDFTISAKIANSQRKWWGKRVVKGELEISVAMVDNTHYSRLQKEHFEIYLYVDDQFIREEKRKSVPSSISLDTSTLSNGEHIVTVGLRTLEDHMGTYTLKINVEN